MDSVLKFEPLHGRDPLAFTVYTDSASAKKLDVLTWV